MSVTLTSGSSTSLDDLCTSAPPHVNTALIHLAPLTNSTKDKGVSLKFALPLEQRRPRFYQVNDTIRYQMPEVYQVKSHSYEVGLVIRMSTYIESIILVNARIGSEQYILTPSICMGSSSSPFNVQNRVSVSLHYFFSLCSSCFHRIACSAVVLDPKFSCRDVTWVLLLSPSFRHRYRSCVPPYTDFFTASFLSLRLCSLPCLSLFGTFSSLGVFTHGFRFAIHHFIIHRSSTVTWCAA